MERQCKVKLRSSIVGDNEGVEFLADGIYCENGDLITIEYGESPETGLNSVNKIIISDGMVTLNRIGDHASTMVFQKGKSCNSMVYTEIGELPVTIFSHNVDLRKKTTEVELKLLYTIDLAGETAFNEFHIIADWA